MLDIGDIIDLANNIDVFEKGVDCYKSGLVSDVKYNKISETIQATVHGTRDYKVKVFLDDEKYVNSKCECPAYETWGGVCKHIVAVFLFLKNQDKIDIKVKSKRNNTDVFDNILSHYTLFDDMDSAEGKKRINVKYFIDFDKYRKNMVLSVKLGTEQMYVLKDVRGFIKAYKEGKEFEFGKSFTYDPANEYFDRKDAMVMELIGDIVNEIDYIKNYSWTAYHVDFISGKNILLTNNNFIKFIEILDGGSIELKADYLKYKKTDTVRGDIDLVFDIASYGDYIRFAVRDMKNITILTDNYSAILYKDTIYRISDRQRDNLKPVLSQLENKKESLVISREKINSFMSYLYPIISETNKIEIDRELKEKIYSRKCQPKLYLDKDGNGIKAKLKYIYGDYVFDSITGMESEPVKDDMVIRDLKLENKIMSILENSDFKVLNDSYHIKKEKDVYKFVVGGLPELTDKIEVYYSDDFNSISLRDKSSVHINTFMNENMNYFDFGFSIEGISQDEIPDILNTLREKKTYYRLKDGSFLSLEEEVFDTIVEVLQDLELGDDSFSDGLVEISSNNAFYVNGKIEKLNLKHYKRNILFKELIMRIREPEDESYELPEGLNCQLREYQMTGFNWIKNLSSFNFGGILADEMGLGKTVQMLTYIKSELEVDGDRRFLVIVPTSLLYNWYEEVKKFTPGVKAEIIAGAKKLRDEKLENTDADIIITSYATFRNDADIYKGMKVYCCILDEAQHIKNNLSKTSKAVRQVKAVKRFALTGTPIENSLAELWSIFDFIMPGYLHSYSKFRKNFEKPIVKNQDEEKLADLKGRIAPFIMRRMKNDVLKELPDKIEDKITVEMNIEQKKIYLAWLDKIKSELEDEYFTRGFNKSRIKILAGLTRLRQICCDPSLFIENYQGESSKLNLLNELLDELLEAGHRTVIFSQFTSMLSIIKEQLDSREIDYYSLDGSTKAIDRSNMVNEFNDGNKDIFLISLKAGGTGLNLVGADTVIHYDPWWNPAVEEQATDRTHRIGQKNKVHVIKLITRGTIEEKVYELQKIKKKMVEDVLSIEEGMISSMSEDEIRNLFEVEDE
ncbi:Superfamily II DNA or RNA helicase, SNF2 family [Dethiosulfatibacter aminovorans DSM 17477]|uniref:Superfamily II DNA or RNA helicase, SNF2 family n=1 Tax=Dethiosulfatibacter aminovorans DSM 17477 TaxID=1121476 RepID=A0A1M6L8W1_9FIRM|nr:SNF2 helicase associated domain-containing protein [Dethiosulfatibacter aminovorans]SHJ67637.1 Superfamily II DNA or RNA helicase, SNF2 family [Dethiosulfatibacter aminovorans DSM 17477]